jgi:hypothetical protein
VSKKSRSGYVTAEAEVDIYVDDLIEEVAGEVLIEEVAKRGLSARGALGCDEAAAREAVDWLRRGEPDEALLILERALFPKFDSIAACMKRLHEISGASS